MKIDLTVNGKPVSVDVPSDMPLLWVLRDELHLYGTKYGCGGGHCGVCTVHLRGRVVRSCQVAISTAAGAQVTTIEGLSADGTHPLLCQRENRGRETGTVPADVREWALRSLMLPNSRRCASAAGTSSSCT